MEKPSIKLYKRISFVFLGIATLVIALVYLITYLQRDRTSADPFIFWTVEHSLSIMITLIIVSIALGYLLSSLTYRELRKSKKESKKLLDTLFLFLNKEEREVISHLVEHKGAATQADISRLPEMNRVKAFRSLQKMQERNLIDITSHGKIRKIALKENVLNILSDSLD